MIFDNAEESIILAEDMSIRLSMLEAQRLRINRLHFLMKPALDLLKQHRVRGRTFQNHVVRQNTPLIDE